MDITVCIFTTVKNSERISAIKNTWCQDFDKVYFFGGNCDHNEDNLIILDVDDGFKALTKKHMLMLKYVYDNLPKTDFYYIAGDDAFLYKEHAEEILKKYNPDEELFYWW